MKIAAQIQAYLGAQKGVLAGATISAYDERLSRWWSFLGLRTPTPLIAKGYLSELLDKDQVSRRTAQTHYMTVRSFYEWLHEAALLPHNPIPKLRRFVVPQIEKQPVTEAQFTSIYNLCVNEGRRAWAYAALCGWETGLRLGDIVTLRKSEVDEEAMTIRRTPQKTIRFGKSLEIPISAALLQAIRNCPPHPEADPSFVCPTLAQKYLFNQHKGLSVEFSRIAAKAGVKTSVHMLRHGLVSRLLSKGVPASVVMSITGQSLKILQGYSHTTLNQKREALAT